MKRWNLLIITVFAVSVKVAAYGPDTTHPLMGERSVNLLKDDFPGNYENIDQAAINAIRSGNTGEDGTGLRGIFHFYNPATGLGLNIAGGQPSALQTALTEVYPSAANYHFDTKWVSAQKYYRNYLLNESPSERINAYRKLGEVMHLLIQDMAQPAHTHDDPHAPHSLGGDGESIETLGENLNQQLPQGTLTEGADFSDPANFCIAVSNIVHNGSMFSGTVLEPTLGGAVIDLPGPNFLTAIYRPYNPQRPYPLAHWEVSTSFGVSRHFPHIMGDGANQDWWPVIESSTTYYFDRQERIPISGQPLQRYFINNFVPLAINYGAGLVKLFQDIVDPPAYMTNIVVRDLATNNIAYEVRVSHSGFGSRSRQILIEPSFKYTSLLLLFWNL